MPYRLINIDIAMIALNTTSVGVLALNWFSEHLTGVGGFIVLMSVAVLNISKAYMHYKSTKKK